VLHENGDAGAVRKISWMAASIHRGRSAADHGGVIPSATWEGDTLVDRHRRLQRQVLVRQPRHAAHDATAHDRAVIRVPITARSSTSSRWTTQARWSSPVQLKFTAHAAPPGSELMEFVCTENNQYGVAADIPNIYRDKGYGLEVEPPAPKK
jgi:hypothetical protein